MQKVEEQKIRLEQKKNRLAMEEVRLKLKERKMRTRHLIEIGGLVKKAGIDHLPTNTLYGALLSVVKSLQDSPHVRDKWTSIGQAKFSQEQQSKTAVIVKFEEQPDSDTKKAIRDHGLKWNKIRSEWYGEVGDLSALKQCLRNTKYDIEVI